MDSDHTIPNRFYRVSIKALILNEARDKFMVVREASGKWELPGGGLDWEEATDVCLKREVLEEMNLPISWMATTPAYFLTYQAMVAPIWVANVLYETEVEHLTFTPSDECVAYEFVSKEDLGERVKYPNVRMLAEMFDPRNHMCGA